ncbi:hypothetical protein JHK85_006641 [Glycine max]|nr:hypothetical protein JHK85_006641 [Glycine max]
MAFSSLYPAGNHFCHSRIHKADFKPNGVTSKSFSTEEEHEQNRKSDHRLKDCSIDILMLDKIIIASYGGNIESEPHELAKLMIVDERNVIMALQELPMVTWHRCRGICETTVYYWKNRCRILICDHIPTVWKFIGLLAIATLLEEERRVQRKNSVPRETSKENKSRVGSSMVLEINLMTFPNVVDAILANGMFSHYDHPHIEQLCENDGLFIWSLQVVNVLLDNLETIDRAMEFAFQVEEDVVWSQVAKAQLRKGLVSDAIESFIHANDSTHFLEVIKVAKDANIYHDLLGDDHNLPAALDNQW